MAKKIGLDLGKREIKPAKVIEETHATPVESVATEKKQGAPIARKPRPKKDWVVKSVRFERSEWEEIERYMEENQISFNALVRDLFKSEVLK